MENVDILLPIRLPKTLAVQFAKANGWEEKFVQGSTTQHDIGELKKFYIEFARNTVRQKITTYQEMAIDQQAEAARRAIEEEVAAKKQQVAETVNQILNPNN